MLGVVLLAVAAADRPAPLAVVPVRLTIPAAEYAAMEPRRAAGGFPFGPAPKTPAPPADPTRELHRNTFGMDLPWAGGDITIDGQTFPNVGVRYKGNGTIGDASRTAKKSFKIDLDRRGGTGRFLGSKTINLHCGVTDPTKYREAFGYHLYRAAGVPAPRTSFAEVRLTVPGKHDDLLLGLYTLTEEVDGAFLRDRFGTSAGLLMKPENLRDFTDRGDDWKRYTAQYRPKREPTLDEAKRVIAFARLVQKADDAKFQKEIDGFLEVDGYLRFLAATTFVANPDSFFALGHNYYLYLHPTTGKLQFIPWDLDRAFANLPVLGTASQQMNLSLTRPYAGPHRLTERVLALPGMKAKYLALVRELSATAFAADKLLEHLTAVEAALKEPLARDAAAAVARKEAAGDGVFGRPPDLRRFVAKRTASVAAQLAGTSTGHIPGTNPPRMGDLLAGPVLTNRDADGDGFLSRTEWLATADRIFTASAKDDRGRVTESALTAGINGMMPRPPDENPQPGGGVGAMLAGPIIKRADADKDGAVTAAELTAAAGELFDRFDKQKAGKLDEDAFADLLSELVPAPAAPQPPPPPPVDTRVMSYNVRYGTAKDGDNHWDKRKELMVDTIKAFNPHLLGTQETLGFQRDYLAEKLPGYAAFGVGRDDGKEKGEMMAVFWRTDRFGKTAGGHFWYGPTPDVPGSKGGDAALPRMATWVKLADKRQPGAKPVLFVNTHFDHVGKVARVEAAKRLRERIAELGAGCAVVLTGDFNAGEGSEPYRTLFGDGATVVDTYRKVHPERAADEGTTTPFKTAANKGNRIDWIGASKDWTVAAAAIVRSGQGGRAASDHFPVTATLRR